MSNEEIIRAFHLMWDNFPEAVMITQKSREVVAVNKKAAEFGLKPGIKCSSIGKPENHKGCQCNPLLIPASRKFALTRAILAKLTAFGFRLLKSLNGLFISASVMPSIIRKSTDLCPKRLRKVFTV